ncbi:MAG: Ig-like domain-containing protein, partial [Lachnospiraceae bacterium]|nr:Ig-like domain-containing protein [Lachnospiraceae bacterium]
MHKQKKQFLSRAISAFLSLTLITAGYPVSQTAHAAADVKITAVSQNPELGFAEGSTTVAPGTTVNLKAIPEYGCRFTGWINEQGDSVSELASYSFEAASDSIYYAQFTPPSLALSDVAGILKDPDGLVKAANCEQNDWFIEGETLRSPNYEYANGTDPIEFYILVPEDSYYKLSFSGNLMEKTEENGIAFFYTLYDADHQPLMTDFTASSSIPLQASIDLPSGDYRLAFWVKSQEDPETTDSYACLNTLTLQQSESALPIVTSIWDGDGDDSNNYDHASVSGQGSYSLGSEAEIVCTPADGYYFYQYILNNSTALYDSSYIYKAQIGKPINVYDHNPINFLAAVYPLPNKLFGDDSFSISAEGSVDFREKTEEGITYYYPSFSSGEGSLEITFTVEEGKTKYLETNMDIGYGKTVEITTDSAYGQSGYSVVYNNDGNTSSYHPLIPFDAGTHTVIYHFDIYDNSSVNTTTLTGLKLSDPSDVPQEQQSLYVRSYTNASTNGYADWSITDDQEHTYSLSSFLGTHYDFDIGTSVQLTCERTPEYTEADCNSDFLGWVVGDRLYMQNSTNVTMDASMGGATTCYTYFADAAALNYTNAIDNELLDAVDVPIQFNRSIWARHDAGDDTDEDGNEQDYLRLSQETYVKSDPLTAVITVPDGRTYFFDFKVSSKSTAETQTQLPPAIAVSLDNTDIAETLSANTDSSETKNYVLPLTAGEHTITWEIADSSSPSWYAEIRNMRISQSSLCTLLADSADDAYGSVHVSGGEYNEADGTYHFYVNPALPQTAVLTAQAKEGYLFDGWQMDGYTVYTKPVLAFTVKEKQHYTADFTRDPAYAHITVSVNDASYGTVTGGGIFKITEDGTQTAILTAAASEGYVFTGWKLDGTMIENSAEPEFEIPLTKDADYFAVFEKKESGNTDSGESNPPTCAHITVSANNAAYGNVSGGGDVLLKSGENPTVTLTATAASGYQFTGWLKNGEPLSDTSNPLTAAVTGDAHYTAVFTALPPQEPEGSDENDPNHSGENAPNHSGENDPNHSGENDPNHSGENDPNHSGENDPNHSGENKKEENPDSTDDTKGGQQPTKTENHDNEKDTHKHTAGEWVVTKEATATETGLKIQTCTICGEELAREVLPKYTVSLNAKGTLPLQVKKTTGALKAVLMDGDAVKSWNSSNPKVATVSKSGKITAKKTGKTKITVTTQKGATASVTLKVQKGAVKTKKLSIDRTKLTLKKGASYTLNVTKTPITTLQKITFTSSKSKVAKVD